MLKATVFVSFATLAKAASPEPVSTAGQPAVDVIAGVAKGLFDDDNLSNCIVHVGETVPSVESSIQDLGLALASMNPEKIKQAIQNVRQVLRDIPQELQDCGANLQDVQNLLDAFKEVVPSILGELVSARASLHLGDWEGVGEHVGRALRLLVHDESGLTTLQENSKADPGPDTDAALQVIKGLSYGLFNDQTFSQCLTEVLQGTPEVESALNNLVTALEGKHLAEIKTAIFEVMKVVKSLPGSLKPCSDNVGDIQRLLVTLKQVGPKFVDDIEQSLRSLRSGDFEDFGENVGKAAHLIIYGDRPDTFDIVV